MAAKEKKASKTKNPHKLTAKQHSFVNEYLIDLNATQAAIRAGYSKNTASVIGHENLKKPYLLSVIMEAVNKRAEKTKINAEWIHKHLGEKSTADLADLYHEDGALKPIHEWPKIWRQGLVSGIEVVQQYEYIDGEKVPDGVVTKLKIADRTKINELVGKHIDVSAFEESILHNHRGKLEHEITTIKRTIIDPK